MICDVSGRHPISWKSFEQNLSVPKKEKMDASSAPARDFQPSGLFNVGLASPYNHTLSLCLLVLFLWRALTEMCLRFHFLGSVFCLHTSLSQKVLWAITPDCMKQETFFHLLVQSLCSGPVTFLLRNTFPSQYIRGAEIMVPMALYRIHPTGIFTSDHKIGFQMLKMFILIWGLDTSFQFAIESVHQSGLHYLPDLLLLPAVTCLYI